MFYSEYPPLIIKRLMEIIYFQLFRNSCEYLKLHYWQGFIYNSLVASVKSKLLQIEHQFCENGNKFVWKLNFSNPLHKLLMEGKIN